MCSSRLLVTFTENISALRKYIHHQILNDHVIKQFPVLDIPQTVPPCPPKATTSYRVGAGEPPVVAEAGRPLAVNATV